MSDNCNCGCVCCNGDALDGRSADEQLAALEEEKQDIERRIGDLQQL